MATPEERLGPPPPADAAGPSRNTQIALVVLGVVVLLFVVWFFLLRSDGEEADVATTAPGTTESEVEAEEPAEEATEKDTVETFEVFAPKDPFEPLISTSTGSGAAGTDTGAAVITGGDTTGTTTVITGGGTGSTGGTTGSGGSDSTTIEGRRVSVIDVFGRGRAQIEVDGTVYTVDEGERFAENFELLSASGQCASMLYGDDQFTLCEGEEILK